MMVEREEREWGVGECGVNRHMTQQSYEREREEQQRETKGQ